ncbi:hypothetical protein GGX14DRAFT_652603 [Mycena pura]|uniref:Uncharacterized protein n=1 Tax=Mycena pura TaxID=153505 RepID=A0AAD6VCG4_9AGAR|nr:hypothetical protein GGX14DRAFT_652603 [Mycena pura]
MARPLKLSNILFNSNARVYNLRLFLLADVVITVLVGMYLGPVRLAEVQVGRRLLCVVTLREVFMALIRISIEHSLFRLDMKGLAVIDLVLVFFELGGYAGGLNGDVNSTYDIISNPGAGMATLATPIARLPGLVLIPTTMVVGIASLAISAVFRISTILYPPYTVTSILLNRAVARPLVRGESKLIIFSRALVLSCLGVLIPAFGFYSIVILPMQEATYIKSIMYLSSIPGPYLRFPFAQQFPPRTGNASFYMYLLSDASSSQVTSQIRVNAYGELIDYNVNDHDSKYTTFNCSPPNINAYEIIVQLGDSVILYMPPWYSRPEVLDNQVLGKDFTVPKPTVLLPGSRLFGLLTWTARIRLESSLVNLDLDGIHYCADRGQGWEYQPKILGLQQNPSDKTDDGTSHLTLLLMGGPCQIFQEATDSSTLSGVTNLGGFWTFVNGAFALLFGANIIYFAFGHSLLSAWRISFNAKNSFTNHKWHEDFPALRTEGGLPGSESAGIVAFIRERLVDLDQPRPRDASEKYMGSTSLHGSDVLQAACHAESLALHSSEESVESVPAEYLTKTAGYILEDIPL